MYVQLCVSVCRQIFQWTCVVLIFMWIFYCWINGWPLLKHFLFILFVVVFNYGDNDVYLIVYLNMHCNSNAIPCNVLCTMSISQWKLLIQVSICPKGPLRDEIAIVDPSLLPWIVFWHLVVDSLILNVFVK